MQGDDEGRGISAGRFPAGYVLREGALKFRPGLRGADFRTASFRLILNRAMGSKTQRRKDAENSSLSSLAGTGIHSPVRRTPQGPLLPRILCCSASLRLCVSLPIPVFSWRVSCTLRNEDSRERKAPKEARRDGERGLPARSTRHPAGCILAHIEDLPATERRRVCPAGCRPRRAGSPRSPFPIASASPAPSRTSRSPIPPGASMPGGA